MIKFVCDLCTAETDEELFILPHVNYIRGGGGTQNLVHSGKLRPIEYHLCDSCREKLVDLCDSIQYPLQK